MNRADFQQLAEIRIAEAAVLLAAGMWDGAYYIAGYAIEFALKACIAKLTQEYDFPSKQAAKCYTHSIEELIQLAGLKAERDAASAKGGALATNWATVQDWREDSRYERNSEAEARELYRAIADPQNGVLPWIKLRW